MQKKKGNIEIILVSYNFFSIIAKALSKVDLLKYFVTENNITENKLFFCVLLKLKLILLNIK